MPAGPGKYDDLATYCREQVDATSVVVMVMGGSRGSGFAIQSRDPMTPRGLAAMLRHMANDIEKSIPTC